jgi:CheY-like chemotaxis protein
MNPTPPQLPVATEILLVEDNPRDADLTIRALKRHRLANHLTWVKNGAEALEILFPSNESASATTIHTPRLVLLDLKLPKVDGHEVLQKIKSDPRTRTVPVVVLTSSREEADLLRAAQTGANSYIVKPVEFDNFVEAVRQVGFYWLLLNQSPAITGPR